MFGRGVCWRAPGGASAANSDAIDQETSRPVLSGAAIRAPFCTQGHKSDHALLIDREEGARKMREGRVIRC